MVFPRRDPQKTTITKTRPNSTRRARHHAPRQPQNHTVPTRRDHSRTNTRRPRRYHPKHSHPLGETHLTQLVRLHRPTMNLPERRTPVHPYGIRPLHQLIWLNRIG